MAVKMRLTRKGRKRAPFYHIVVADARSPRDGKFIEKLGTYNPMTKPATIEIDREAAYDWLVKGAQPTDTVKAILRFKGVYYKKHLMRGLKKGALTIEQVEDLLSKWIENKDQRIEARKEQTKAEKLAFHKMVSGEAKPKAVVADAETKQAAEAFMVTSDEETTTAEEEVVAAAEETVAEAVQETEAAASEEASNEESAEESEKTEE
jgi:small subunit ribosomal protein S16